MYTRPTAPRTIGGVIDDAIRLYTASLRAWLLPCVIGSALGGGLGLWVTLQFGARPGAVALQMMTGGRAPLFWAGYAVLMLVSIWANFAVTGAIVRVVRGEQPRNGAVLIASLRALPAAVLGSILFSLAAGVGVMLLLVPGLWLIGRWMYWAVPVMDEGSSAPDALARSFELSRGNWWRGVTVVTVALIIIIVLSLVFSFVVGFAAALLHADALVVAIATQCLSALLNVFILPAGPAAIVAMYCDLQLRREGGDLAARVGGLTST